MENKKKFKLFDMNRDGKGVDENEDRTPTLKFFFKLLKRRMSRLVSLNFLMLLMVIPIILAVYFYLEAPTTPTTLSHLYAPLYGISLISDAPSVDVMLSTVDAQLGMPVLPISNQILVLVCILFLLLTWGLQNVGTAYVLRGFYRGDAVFILSDYFYGIKRNWKQALGIGTLDFFVILILVIDYIYVFQTTGSFWNDFMFYMIFAIAFIYTLMRFYIYQLLITFDMKWTKILKNSFIFALLGIKRNLMAFLGILIMVVLNVLLIVLLFPFTVPMILPAFYLFSFSGFMTVYAAYPIIEKYLILPYYEKHPEENPDNIVDDSDALIGDGWDGEDDTTEDTP